MSYFIESVVSWNHVEVGEPLNKNEHSYNESKSSSCYIKKEFKKIELRANLNMLERAEKKYRKAKFIVCIDDQANPVLEQSSDESECKFEFFKSIDNLVDRDLLIFTVRVESIFYGSPLSFSIEMKILTDD